MNWTAAASARCSRCRDTAARMSFPKKAPIAPAAQMTSPAARSVPPPLRLLVRELDRTEPRESPASRNRTRPIAATAVIPPTTDRRRTLSRASPFSTCENSCATTPCSSSRSRRSSAPRVTATTACSGVSPAAKALIPSSPGRTNRAGTGSPDATAISSATFTRRRSPGSEVRRSTGTPPSIRATAGPPSESRAAWNAYPPSVTHATSPATTTASSGVKACTPMLGDSSITTALRPAQITATVPTTARRKYTTRMDVRRLAAAWAAKKSIVARAGAPTA